MQQKLLDCSLDVIPAQVFDCTQTVSDSRTAGIQTKWTNLDPRASLSSSIAEPEDDEVRGQILIIIST